MNKLFSRYDDAACSLPFLTCNPMWNSYSCSIRFPWVLLLRCDDESMDSFHYGLLTFSRLHKRRLHTDACCGKQVGERERERQTQACSAALSVIKLHGHYRCFACVYAHFHTHTTTPGKPRKGQSWMERYNKRDSEREGSKRQDYEVWKNQEDVMQKEIYGRM